MAINRELPTFKNRIHGGRLHIQNVAHEEKAELETAPAIIDFFGLFKVVKQLAGSISNRQKKLVELNKRGIIFLIVVHNIDFIMSLCDKLAAMANITKERGYKNVVIIHVHSD